MSSTDWAVQIPLADAIRWLSSIEAGTGEDQSGLFDQNPPIAYIAALCEHISKRTQYELMLTAFRKQSILREVASVYTSSLLAKVYPEFAEDYLPVVIKASECWHNHEDNAFDPVQGWKGLPTPAEAACMDPFPGAIGQYLLEYTEKIPYLRRMILLTGRMSHDLVLITLTSDLPIVDEAPTRRSQSVDRHPGASIMELDDVNIAPPDATDSPVGLGLTLEQEGSASAPPPHTQSAPSLRGRPLTRRAAQAFKELSNTHREALAPPPDTPQHLDNTGGNSDETSVRGSGTMVQVERRAAPLDQRRAALSDERRATPSSDDRRHATPAGFSPFGQPVARLSAAVKKRGTLLGMVNAHLNAVGPSSPSLATDTGSTSVGLSRASEQPSSRPASSRVPATKPSRTAFSPETGPSPKKHSTSRGSLFSRPF
ncbi:hypothetical protein BDV93DRAFT_565879 [Ceratobasidium sp. AG-I]|nr:hypothetical protein BDV93DRAFT_565879 [Ceratobasidium sp. AG-I]